jgi:glycosyltransferase involved in cell wall biosynthesis
VRVVVFPSVWAEPFGLVVAEAMAAGVPFVISDAGALPEVAGPDHPWIARSGDADDLARVIESVLAGTPEEVRAVTDRARRRWEEQYSPGAGRQRVQRLLEELGVR